MAIKFLVTHGNILLVIIPIANYGDHPCHMLPQAVSVAKWNTQTVGVSLCTPLLQYISLPVGQVV